MNDPATLRRCIAKCEQKAQLLQRRGCSAQARVASELAASFKSMLSQAQRPRVVTDAPDLSLPPAQPPPALPPIYRMTDLARGFSHEAYVAAGWTDAQLLQHGYMEQVI